MSHFDPSKWTRPLLQFAAPMFTVWAGFVVLGSIHHFLFIWPLTAVQVSIALGDWRNMRARISQLSACWIGHALAYQLLGMPPWIGIWRAAVQIVEVAVVVTILYPAVVRFEDLKKRENLLRFGIAAFVVPIFTVALAAKPISGLTHASLFQSWLIAAPSDCLGVAVVLPALLLFSSRDARSLRRLRPVLRSALVSVAVFAAAAAAVFSYDSLPLLFMVFPPMVLLVFLTGLEGATFASLTVTVVAG